MINLFFFLNRLNLTTERKRLKHAPMIYLLISSCITVIVEVFTLVELVSHTSLACNNFI